MSEIQQRNPTEAEMFRGLANSLIRLNGECDETASAIQDQMAEPDFEAAAHAIHVPVTDLVEVFRDEMRKLGFILAPMGRPQ